MPAHDWTLVESGIFHAFHTAWIGQIQSALNAGLLPKGYYALGEQHAGRTISDLLTLHASPAEHSPELSRPLIDSGGTAVAEAPPKVLRRQSIEPSYLARRRTLSIRHVSQHRLIAMIEIVSPGNKDRERHIDEFTEKAVAALESGIHLLIVDLFPPGSFDPHGLHEIICRKLEPFDETYDLPDGKPLTLAAYTAGPRVEAYLDHLAVGDSLTEMPLFLNPDRYVNVPLESTYQAAYDGMPEFWRDVIEGRTE